MNEMIFPTALHRASVEVITTFFQDQSFVDTILLVNSLARGVATPDSDIDMAVLASPRSGKAGIKKLDRLWRDFSSSNEILLEYRRSGDFALLHLDIIDGNYELPIWEDGGSVDFFEVEIGNQLLYSRVVGNEGDHFKELRAKWLPYYNDQLQLERARLSKLSCVYELEHIPVFVKRRVHFQAFDRLYMAFQKFLQALFIRYKTYPIAYNKWIKEQVAEILRLPELYQQLPGILSVKDLESDELIEKAKNLRSVLEQYC